jgi:hypothetical protein
VYLSTWFDRKERWELFPSLDLFNIAYQPVFVLFDRNVTEEDVSPVIAFMYEFEWKQGEADV